MSKSEIMKQVAENLGLTLIDVKVSPAAHSDFLGQPMMDKIVIIDDCDPVIDAMTREIKIGDMVLMEIQKDVMEHVLVEAIEDGVVYGTGEDGEEFCSTIENCDKVPF